MGGANPWQKIRDTGQVTEVTDADPAGLITREKGGDERRTTTATNSTSPLLTAYSRTNSQQSTDPGSIGRLASVLSLKRHKRP